MTARVFVDTNVLVYQLDSREPGKQAQAGAPVGDPFGSNQLPGARRALRYAYP
jgi:hypothetical protein